jgi:hypothetical protein
MFLRTRFTGKATALLIALGSLVGLTRAQAQVFLTFSGGNGSEVAITWSSPIVYTLTGSTGISGKNPVFVFQAIANSQTIFQTSGAVGGAAITYSSTGAGSTDGTQTIDTLAAPNTFNSVTAGDVVFFAVADTANTLLTAGDVITLSAGSLRYTGAPNSSASYNGVLPANGLYNTFITDGSNTYAANLGSGSAIPEPSTYAAIAGAAMLGLATWRRRRSKQPE